MKVHKKISRLRSYFEAVWMSARFYFMLRKMNRLRSENRKGILWRILCSLMSVQGIFTCIKGYVEMMLKRQRQAELLSAGFNGSGSHAQLKLHSDVLSPVARLASASP